MSGSEKPSDWIRDRAQTHMPEGWGLGINSRPHHESPEAFSAWANGIIDYLDRGVDTLTPTEREEVAGQLTDLLARLDG